MKAHNFFLVLVFALAALRPSPAEPQDFGFGFDDEEPGFQARIGGQIQAELKAFFDDFSSYDKVKDIKLGNIFSGSLNFEAQNSLAMAAIKLDLVPDLNDPLALPVRINEAFVRAFLGPVTVEGGIRKLSWGRADSFGPLDLINPLDYSDLSALSDPQSMKIGRPMINASLRLGSFTNLSAVFVPWFQGHSFAMSGKWAPRQVTELYPALEEGINNLKNSILMNFPASYYTYDFTELEEWQESFAIENYYKSFASLKYAQAGMRFTTTIGSSDFGIQYYFGRFPRPRVIISMDAFIADATQVRPLLSTITPNPSLIQIDVDHTWYHHAAADFGRVIYGFNIRAEAGANITSDLDGKDGKVENPALIWSLGFDRDLSGLAINVQGSGRVRLFHDNLGDDPFADCEAGSSRSSTRITGILSKKFLRDETELKLTALWGIEDRDFMIVPSVSWARNDLKAELSAGFFGGDRKGELGQYRGNGYTRLALSYYF